MALPNADFGAVFACISFAHDNNASKTGFACSSRFSYRSSGASSANACSEERPNSFFLDSFSCSSSHSFYSERLVITCACSCSRAASFASSFAFRAFSCCKRSYSAREMVTISTVLLVCISLFSMRKLYYKAARKASIFNGFPSLFSAQTALNPVTGRWAFGCLICSPSMSQRYCCGVKVFTSDSERGH